MQPGEQADNKPRPASLASTLNCARGGAGGGGSPARLREPGATLGPVAHARCAPTRKSRGTPGIRRGATA
jgi:hypothetical protein